MFVAQLEGEGHGHEPGIAVPQELRAGRVAGTPEPSAAADIPARRGGGFSTSDTSFAQYSGVH